jgi:vacuolar protein sorting-associated protein 13A/C
MPRFKLLLGNLQLDNQLPMTVLPVLFAPEGNHDLANPVLQISFEVCGSNSETTAEVYPYIRVEVMLLFSFFRD